MDKMSATKQEQLIAELVAKNKHRESLSEEELAKENQEI